MLATRKLSVIMLDRRPIAGGAAVTTEFAPGFRAPALQPCARSRHRDVVRALQLDRAGLEFITPDPALTALGHDGKHDRLPSRSGADGRIDPSPVVRRRGPMGRVREDVRSGSRAVARRSAASRRRQWTTSTARELWRLLGVGRARESARPTRSGAPRAMDADVGRRSGRRVVRKRSAPGGDRGACGLRQSRGAVVGRHRRRCLLQRFAVDPLRWAAA